MVTAILIPIICFYFLWLSVREAKENEKKWLEAGIAKEEAIVEGMINSVTLEKQRFYYHRFLLVQELTMKTASGILKARIIVPLRKNSVIEEYHPGRGVRLYGSWQKNWFHVNRVEPTKEK
ncbi:hypothetical protein [Bacillus sp. B-jedd]|uniref:hypothetical protein n=1 Tax=Bacillus sp. B-jedd TaxID=1476857 RepID=UPI0005156399|nr:hypothetical protein [Bacillus sp. B-jedd]CEG26699.1 hypothetical protein BN1002_01549 [Bacillus sp. B-jedd]